MNVRVKGKDLKSRQGVTGSPGLLLEGLINAQITYENHRLLKHLKRLEPLNTHFYGFRIFLNPQRIHLVGK